ncbi:MAG: FHA domain-containing protein [Bacteroidia bacterium]|nr:FHA domain-containing protein [Bacteroidia bacterium]
MSLPFDPQKTEPMGSPSPESKPTSSPSDSVPFDPKRTQIAAQPGSATFDPNRTHVYQGPGVSPLQRQIPQNRKLVGWLVSFSLHPNGVDFRLYEGKNTVGSHPSCDIVLQDPAVSSHHLTILFRLGTFRFKDELSTNGTFVNGQLQDEGELKDGDSLRVGQTEFRLRTV